MVGYDDDDLYRRVRRLEALISALIISDDLGDPDFGFFLRRALDNPRDRDFTYYLSEFLRYEERDGFERRRSINRRLNKLEERTKELSVRLDQALSYNNEDSLASRVQTIASELRRLSDETGEMRQETHEKFVVDTMGLDHSKVAQKRFAPVRVYISEDSPKLVEIVEKATKEYTDALGFTPASEYPAEKGSWFKRWIAKSKDALTSEQAEEAFKKGKRSIELTTLDKKRAEVNRENAQAAGDFIRAIENVPNAVAQFGSLLIIKTTTPDGGCSVMTRVLSEKEMEFIENNQDIMKDATRVLDRLAEVKIDHDTTIKIGR